jgi:hypothetical protein
MGSRTPDLSNLKIIGTPGSEKISRETPEGFSLEIGHFLAIVAVYKEIKRLGELDAFLVEPKYGNEGTAETDVFCI